MIKIILATTSPYRIEAFKFLDIPFESEGSDVDESQIERSDPEKLVETLSELKAQAVADKHSDAIIIGMDSVSYFNGKIFEKPKSREENFVRLKSLSGKQSQFYTGICMINNVQGKKITKVVKTEIFFRDISEAEINKYLDQDKYFNTYASGYDPLKYISSTFISRLEGSYNNPLRGIPLEVIVDMLQEIGYKDET